MTVSLALRHHPSIPARTRMRVRDAAKRLGYAPDPELLRLVRYMREQRHRRFQSTIAVLNCWPDEGYVTSYPYQKRLWGAIHARAAELGYAAEVVWAGDPAVTPRRLAGILEARGIRGVLLPPPPPETRRTPLDLRRFTAVAMSNTWHFLRIHQVLTHQYGVMKTALHELEHRGFRRIALALTDDQDQRTDHQWLAAYLHRDFHLPERHRIPVLKAPRLEVSRVGEWLRAHAPEVLILPDVPTRAALAEAGWRFPRDVGLATLTRQGADDRTSGVDPNPELVGSAAVDLLTSMLNRNERGRPQPRKLVSIDGSWVDGQTLPAGNERAARR